MRPTSNNRVKQRYVSAVFCLFLFSGSHISVNCLHVRGGCTTVDAKCWLMSYTIRLWDRVSFHNTLLSVQQQGERFRVKHEPNSGCSRKGQHTSLVTLSTCWTHSTPLCTEPGNVIKKMNTTKIISFQGLQFNKEVKTCLQIIAKNRIFHFAKQLHSRLKGKCNNESLIQVLGNFQKGHHI